MLRTINQEDDIAASRLFELLSPHPAWHRSLWNVGLVLMMEELCEACTAHRLGTLSESSVKRLISSLVRVCGKDPALNNQEKAFLNEHVRTVPRPDGVASAAIAQLGQQVKSNYLRRWAGCCRAGQVATERFARSVAAHLLDLGFSRAYLHDLSKNRLYMDSAPSHTRRALRRITRGHHCASDH